MILATCSYAQFKSLKTLLGAKFMVIYHDKTDASGWFYAIATDGGSVCMRFEASAKPADFDLTFGLVAQLVDSVAVDM